MLMNILLHKVELMKVIELIAVLSFLDTFEFKTKFTNGENNFGLKLYIIIISRYGIHGWLCSYLSVNTSLIKGIAIMVKPSICTIVQMKLRYPNNLGTTIGDPRSMITEGKYEKNVTIEIFLADIPNPYKD